MAQEMTKEMQEALTAQKVNCPFCKIVKGEIPASIVYQDAKVMAIADINPVVNGHILLFPKEHYPILPIIPPDVSNHLYAVARDISRTIKKAMITTTTAIYVANGGAAGQQTPHFMLHVFPREKNDRFSEVFSLKPNEEAKKKNAQLAPSLKANLQKMFGDTDPQTPSHVSSSQKKSLADYIEQHDDFRVALVGDLTKAKTMIAKDPALQKLVEGVDIDKLHERLKGAMHE